MSVMECAGECRARDAAPLQRRCGVPVPPWQPLRRDGDTRQGSCCGSAAAKPRAAGPNALRPNSLRRCWRTLVELVAAKL